MPARKPTVAPIFQGVGLVVGAVIQLYVGP